MRALLSILLAAAALVAGCVSAPAALDDAADLPPLVGEPTGGVLHAVDGALLDAAPPGLVQAVGGAFHTGLSASEPTIGVLSDGTVFMTANKVNPTCATAGCPPLPYANFNAGPTLVRSKDQGQTWEDVFPKLPTGDSYKLRTWDPYVYVDRGTDRVFMDDIYPIGCGFMSFSDDAGASWMHNPASCGNPQVNDHQTVGTGKPRGTPTAGYPNLVYRCVNNLVYIGCAVSVNGGQTFLPQVPIEAAMGQCGGITGHLESDHEGRVYLPVFCDGKPAVAVTEDDARTWTVHAIADQEIHGLHVDMAVDEAGNVYALWEHEGLPWFASSVDHGATWSEARMVAAPGVTMIKFNAIAAGAPGKVAFAYVGTTIPNATELPAAECGILPALPCTNPEEWADATWNAYVATIQDALAETLVIQTVTANDPADPLARGACADRCHGMTDFIDVQIGADGRPWASFVDVCVAECVTDPSVLFDGNLGLAATLLRGPALRGEAAELAAIAPQAAHAAPEA